MKIPKEITESVALEILANLAGVKDDPERNHSLADTTLVAFIRGLGHGDVADLWESISPKWYA